MNIKYVLFSCVLGKILWNKIWHVKSKIAIGLKMLIDIFAKRSVREPYSKALFSNDSKNTFLRVYDFKIFFFC